MINYKYTYIWCTTAFSWDSFNNSNLHSLYNILEQIFCFRAKNILHVSIQGIFLLQQNSSVLAPNGMKDTSTVLLFMIYYILWHFIFQDVLRISITWHLSKSSRFSLPLKWQMAYNDITQQLTLPANSCISIYEVLFHNSPHSSI